MVRASVALMFVGSLLWLSTYVLVPSRLDAEGWSAADIGLAFSASSLVFAGVSWWVARRADRWATLGVASAATAALAASLLVVVASGGIAATLLFLMLAARRSMIRSGPPSPSSPSGPDTHPSAPSSPIKGS